MTPLDYIIVIGFLTLMASAGFWISRLIKDSKLKVTAALQGDKVRISGKQRDDLQQAIQLLRAAKLETPLQFNNFRD